MKVCVTGYAGNVGKTLVASQVIGRNMPGAMLYAIESINGTAEAYGEEVEKIRGEKYQKLYKDIMLLDDAIIDVGASNVVQFQEGMLRYSDSQKELDVFVIPTTSGTKEQKEAIAMVETLRGLGIGPERIKIVCNRVVEDVEEEFSMMFAYARKEGTCILSPDAAIWESELMDMMHVRHMSLDDLLSDMRDYRSLARELGPDADPALREKYRDLHVMKALAMSVYQNFNTVFNAIFQEGA